MEKFNQSIENFKHISSGFFYAVVLTLILSSCSLERQTESEVEQIVSPSIYQPTPEPNQQGIIFSTATYTKDEELIPPVVYTPEG